MPTRNEVETARRTVPKTAREYRRDLEDLTTAVSTALARLDVAMLSPESLQRGKIIAEIANALDLANDRALHFGLGKTFAAMTREKHRLQSTLTSHPRQAPPLVSPWEEHP